VTEDVSGAGGRADGGEVLAFGPDAVPVALWAAAAPPAPFEGVHGEVGR
jgi:hypothetical protein